MGFSAWRDLGDHGHVFGKNFAMEVPATLAAITSKSRRRRLPHNAKWKT
jgi:hypothetical protein